MIFIANILLGVGQVFGLFLDFFTFMIIASAVLSWVNADRYNPIVRFITGSVEPLLSRIRRILPVVYGGIDFSPMILIAAIVFMKSAVAGSLVDLALSMKQGALYQSLPLVIPPRGETL
jgi:YggT family protein